MLRYILAAIAALVLLTASLIPDDAYARGGRGGGGYRGGGGGRNSSPPSGSALGRRPGRVSSNLAMEDKDTLLSVMRERTRHHRELNPA